MRVGFPWISLDSLVIIEPFQWVTRLFAGRKFLAAFCGWGGPRQDRSRYSYGAEAQYGSSSKPNSFSAFLQSITFELDGKSVELGGSRHSLFQICIDFMIAYGYVHDLAYSCTK
jgi:hypothetical protein